MTPLPIEYRKGVTHSYLALLHPRWLYELAKGGMPSVYIAITRDSIQMARENPIPASLEDLASTKLNSPLSRMGATQEYLFHLIRLFRPTRIVETGVYRGISTAFILAALHEVGNGKLVSIDLPNASYVDEQGRTDSTILPSHSSTGFVVPSEYRNRWTLKLGDARTLLPSTLTELDWIDMFYHDSEHTYSCMQREFQQALGHMPHGGVILSDDVNLNSAFKELSESARVRSWRIFGRKLGVATIAGLDSGLIAAK